LNIWHIAYGYGVCGMPWLKKWVIIELPLILLYCSAALLLYWYGAWAMGCFCFCSCNLYGCENSQAEDLRLHSSRLHASRLHGFFHASRLHASHLHGFFHASRFTVFFTLHVFTLHGFFHASRLHASRFTVFFTLHVFTLHAKLNLPYPSSGKRDFLCGIFLIIPLCKGGTARGIFCCSTALLLCCSIGMGYGLFL